MNKKLLPITLLCLLGLVACGVNTKSSSTVSSVPSSQAPSSQSSQPQPSSSSSAPSSQSSVAPSSSSSAPSSSSTSTPSSSSSAPSSQSSVAPSSSSSSEPSSSSSDPIQYGVAITNKTEFEDWHAGDENITLGIELTPAANVRAALSEGELVITSSNPSVISVSGLVLTAQDAGNATITATYHGQSDSVDVTVKAEDIKTIADIIANSKKNDVITFKGYYLGHNSRINYLGSDTYPYVYVGDGQQSIILYCMPATYLEGIEVGDLVKVSGKYSPYNGLPETASGSVTKFVKTTSETVVRPTTTVIDAEHPSFTMSMDNIGSPVHVEGAEVSKVVKVEAKKRSDLEPAVNGQAVETNYYERTYKIKVGENEYDFFINERYVTPSQDITDLSVGDKVSFDAFVNIPEVNKFNLAMPSNIVRVASVKDPVESLTLSAAQQKLYAGKTLALTAKVLPDTALQNVTWASSNNEVATVAGGVVTGVKAGNVTITATTVGQPVKTASIDLEVVTPITEAQHAGTSADPYTVDDAVLVVGKLADKAYSANEIYVEGKVCSASYDETNGFTIWLEDAVGSSAFELYRAVLDAEVFTNAELNAFYQGSYKDANDKTVGNLVGHTVKAHGYAQRYGSTLELAGYTPEGGSKVTPTIYEVSEGVLAALSLPETLNLVAGAQQTLTLTVSPIDAKATGVVWSSSVESVALVDQEGKVTAVAEGESVITAAVGDIKAQCTVSVASGDIKATAIELDKTTVEALVGDKVQLTATVTPSNSTEAVSWVSSDETKATVDENGLVTVLDAGSITITATAGDVSASCVITATHEHGTVADDPLTVPEAVAIGEALEDKASTAKKYFIKGIVSQIDENNFGDGNYENATFWLYNGEKVKGFEGFRLKLAEGVSSADFRVGAEVTINANIKKYGSTIENNGGLITAISFNHVHATAIALNKASLDLEEGAEETLEFTLTPADSTDSVIWSSSNDAVATVTQKGKVTAVAAGTATITVKVSDEIKAECVVTVSAATGNVEKKLFEADLTDTMSVTGGFEISSSATKKTGYYQDTGTADSAINYFMVKGASALFASAPSKITFTASLGAGSDKDPLDHNVEVCLVDSEGNDIAATKVTLTTKLTKAAATYSIELPYSADAYGVKLSHMKENSWNARYYSFNLSYEEGGATTPVEIAQPVGSFYGYAINASDDSNIFVDIALADSKAFVEVGTLLKTTVDFTFDKTTGVVTIPLGGNFGNLTATYDEANNKLTNVAVDGAAAAMLKNNGSLELVAATKFWDCNGTTAELQAMFKRRYMSGSWQVDNSNADRFVSYENGICGSAMQRRGYGSGAVALNLATDMEPVEVSNIGFWVYNPGASDLTLRMWIYKSANLQNNAELGSVTAVAGQWTYCRMGFTKASIYNFQIADFNNSGVALVFDNIVLF